MQIRLDKFLADAGIGTRSEVKSIMKRKSVTVNGICVTRPETKVNPDTDEVAVSGSVVSLCGKVTYLLHKPAGYVCAVKDSHFPTVMELVPPHRDLFPVGRLDKDTEGLLLITNDGAMAHRMLSPRSHVDKTYLAVLDAPAEESYAALFAEGVDIGDETLTFPAKFEICDATTVLSTQHGICDAMTVLPAQHEICDATTVLPVQHNSCDNNTPIFSELSEVCDTAAISLVQHETCATTVHALKYLPEEYHTGLCPGQVVLLTIREGRYHQVKRMFHAVGRKVIYLKRLSFGSHVLPLSLKKGEAIPCDMK